MLFELSKTLQSIHALTQSQHFRWLVSMTLFVMIVSLPLSAQFTGGTTLVDPTQGAQSLAKYIVDGMLYIVASAAFVCFCWGFFHLFGPRKLEGILEMCLGLIVFGLVGHALAWDAALTNVTVG